MKILIVNETKSSARLLEDQLRRAGYEVAVAFDAWEALRPLDQVRATLRAPRLED